MNGKISAIMIVEVMGRPVEHLIETLEGITKKIGEEKGVKIVEEKTKEPTLIKDQKDLFTTYSEIEMELDEPMILAGLMFKYMPAHVELIEPEHINMTNNDFTSILNELTRRLHKYEEVVRIMQTEKQILENQLKKTEDK